MIDCPVVPAGMFALATTTDVVAGATLTLDPVFLLAPFTLANAMALPATNRMTPITTNMSVCRFTETFPLLNRRKPCCSRDGARQARRLRWRVRRDDGNVHRSF